MRRHVQGRANLTVSVGDDDGPHAVTHIPHSSTQIPRDLRETFLLSDIALELELLRLTDRYTDELFDLGSSIAVPVVFGVSRFVVDPERFTDDASEPMAARGMGAVYTATTGGEPLRAQMTASERGDLLARFYEPHHARLETAAQGVLDRTGRCLIIDAHSFPSNPLPCDLDQDPERPDVCIGTDPFHTPAQLATDAAAALSKQGLAVAVNRPYRGALVPTRWYRRDPRVSSVMVEINRRLYLDEETGERTAEFTRTRAMVISALTALIDQHLASSLTSSPEEADSTRTQATGGDPP